MSELDASQPSVFDGLNHIQLAELRTDHAGELGAVWIYKGILFVTKDEELRKFAKEHLATESQHFRFFQEGLPKAYQSLLSPLWKIAGWMLGAVPAFFGRNAVYATIDAVETFVVQHYEEQLNIMPTGLRVVLERFMHEEGDHRDEAAVKSQSKNQLRWWRKIVSGGSALAVRASRHL